MKKNNLLWETAKYCLAALSFFVPDFLLRYFTRWLGYYSIFEPAPSLFSLCWIGIFVVLLSLFPRRTGRIVYVVLYGMWTFYAEAQYIYYLIFDKFFYISDAQYAGEGGAYLEHVTDMLNGNVLVMLGICLAAGAVCFRIFPDFAKIGSRKIRTAFRSGMTALAVAGMCMIPGLYTDTAVAYFSSKYEYVQFTNSGFDMEIAGLYQYVARDVYFTYFEPEVDQTALYEQVDSFLESKASHQEDNEMTGIFEGKNLILIQMETIDDWMVTEEVMPTLHRLMGEGINFTNMYTCLYGSGWTFSTEFAFNTGIYQNNRGVAAYSLTQNSFPYSIANIFRDQGYTCKSFHENASSYYTRSSMHPAMGYERYFCTAEPVSEAGDLPKVDTTMVTNDICWDAMTPQEPFMSYLITYSAHLPYDLSDEVVQYAYTQYPEYNVPGRDPELNALYAKARLTDDMLKLLLERLEADGLLSNTVIIAYADHYCYSLSDQELAKRLSEENGSDILERTPAIIWYDGCESVEVDKVCQTVDWVPTIANLFGADVSAHVVGSDIFDDSYEGYAIFPDGTWLTNEAYAVNGIIHHNSGMTEDEIRAMNEYVQQFYQANEAILVSDYYARSES